MNNIGEVKKKIEIWQRNPDIYLGQGKGYRKMTIDDLALQICQLFEPKPDESRELEMAKMAWGDFLHAHADECDVDAVVDLIVATTASIEDAKCQQRVERIFSYIEKQFGGYEGGQGKRRIVIHEGVWQAFKKQEQVSNG